MAKAKSSAPAHPSRTDKPKTAELSCVGCRQSLPRRELVVGDDDRHDNLAFFDGDKLCRPCARRNGVSY
jgi:hypothetical protein